MHALLVFLPENWLPDRKENYILLSEEYFLIFQLEAEKLNETDRQRDSWTFCQSVSFNFSASNKNIGKNSQLRRI